MSIYEIQETQTSSDGHGNSMAFTGAGWSSSANTAFSGGAAQTSSTVGNSVTVTFTGRCLYLLCRTTTAEGVITVSIDSVAQPGSINLASSVGAYRILVPIARGLSDGAHTAVLTLSATPVFVDSFLVVTGSLVSPTPGNLVTLGDSVTFGVGVVDSTRTAWAPHLQSLLSYRAPNYQPVNLINKGVSGDNFFGTTNALTGGMYRLVADVVANAPQYLTIMFGINDIFTAGALPADMARFLLATLMFLEDTLDTTQVKVAVGTNTNITPNSNVINVVQQTGYKPENYLFAVSAIRMIVAQFKWCRLADTYALTEGRATLSSPNFNVSTKYSDVHPNDAGHSVIALAFYQALTSSGYGVY